MLIKRESIEHEVPLEEFKRPYEACKVPVEAPETPYTLPTGPYEHLLQLAPNPPWWHQPLFILTC